MYESLDWNEKALKRKLISKSEYDYNFSELQKLPKLIHQLIKFKNINYPNNNETIEQ